MDKYNGSPKVLTISTDQENWPRVLAKNTSHVYKNTNQADILSAGLAGAQRAPRCGRRPPDVAQGHQMWPKATSPLQELE